MMMIAEQYVTLFFKKYDGDFCDNTCNNQFITIKKYIYYCKPT